MQKRLVTYLLAVVAAMLALTYASVPIYSIFCKVTGFGGYVKRIDSDSFPKTVGKKVFVVHFNTDTSLDLPWKFTPDQREVRVLTGKTGLAFYRVENTSDKMIDGMAVYNVTPTKVAKYFSKVACFCFTRQTLGPKQRVFMPVTFVIDPAIEDDPEVAEVKTITLSYNFFPYNEGFAKN